MESKWELVDDERGQTDRLKIPGGWLYRTTVSDRDSDVVPAAMVFVPDPEKKKKFRLVHRQARD
jgi:hypothetical protein